MLILDELFRCDPKLAIFIPILALALVYLVPFLSDHHGLLGYPGPLLAKLSNLWFANLVLKGNNVTMVHEMHKKYGVLFTSPMYCTDC